MLVNNAAVMANPGTRLGPGWESQLATYTVDLDQAARLWALSAGLTGVDAAA